MKYFSTLLIIMLLCSFGFAQSSLAVKAVEYQGRNCLEITNPYYIAVVDSAKGGRISWLSVAGSKQNMADSNLGIGNIGLPELTTRDKPHKIKHNASEDGKTVSVRLSCDDANEIRIIKEYIFRADTPTIQCRVELVNFGTDRMLQSMAYNHFDVQKDGQKNEQAAVFFDVPSRPEIYPATLKKWTFQTDPLPTVGGVFFGSRQSALIFIAPADMLHRYTLLTSPKDAAYEINLRRHPFKSKKSFAFNFFFAPVKANSVETAIAMAREDTVYPAEIRKIAEAVPPRLTLPFADSFVKYMRQNNIKKNGSFEQAGTHGNAIALQEKGFVFDPADNAWAANCSVNPLNPGKVYIVSGDDAPDGRRYLAVENSDFGPRSSKCSLGTHVILWGGGKIGEEYYVYFKARGTPAKSKDQLYSPRVHIMCYEYDVNGKAIVPSEIDAIRLDEHWQEYCGVLKPRLTTKTKSFALALMFSGKVCLDDILVAPKTAGQLFE